MPRKAVPYNADFDMSFIIENCKRQGLPQEYTYVDTVGMARFLLPALNRFKLDTVAKAVGVSLDHHHRAVDDAACTAEIFVRFVEMLRERDIFGKSGYEGVVYKNVIGTPSCFAPTSM